MRKKYSLISIGIILVGILSICIMIFINGVSVISSVEAETALQDYLVGANQWEDDYVLEPTNPIGGKIGNNEVYRFEVRYKDTVEEVGNKLISNYAITVGGNSIFWYDSANDEWIVQK